MLSGTMLQLVVDDADAYAATARANGPEPFGPVDVHGERIYYLALLSGLPMSFISVCREPIGPNRPIESALGSCPAAGFPL